MNELPRCRHRREETEPGRHRCDSDKLVILTNGVNAEQCNACPYPDHTGAKRRIDPNKPRVEKGKPFD